MVRDMLKVISHRFSVISKCHTPADERFLALTED